VTKCAKCDEELIEGHLFCTYCGTKQESPPEPQQASPPEPQQASPPEPQQASPPEPQQASPPEPQQDTPQSNVEEPSEVSNTSKTGKLVFPDDSKIEIDESQRLVGRADLIKFSNEDPKLISRGHFTIYEKNAKYYINDGNTIVQEKPSTHHTFLNEEDITDKGKVELSDGDIIKVSEVEISFKFE